MLATLGCVVIDQSRNDLLISNETETAFFVKKLFLLPNSDIIFVADVASEGATVLMKDNEIPPHAKIRVPLSMPRRMGLSVEMCQSLQNPAWTGRHSVTNLPTWGNRITIAHSDQTGSAMRPEKTYLRSWFERYVNWLPLPIH